MNIICERESLLEAIALLKSVVPQKSQARPILYNIECIAKDKTLSLKATDLEMALYHEVPLVKCYDGGQLLLPAEQLLDILKATHDKEIKMESLDKTALISGENFQYKLPSIANEAFPEVPELEGESIKLERRSLIRMINEVSFAMNKDRSRYSLNSLLICLTGNTIEAVATDQIRLAFSSAELSERVEDEEKYIFPAKAVSILQSILSEDPRDEIELVKGKNQVTIKFNKGFFITRLVDAQFPNYRNAYSSFKDVDAITLKTDDFASAIRQMTLLTCENARNIALMLTDGQIVLKASTPKGEGKVEMLVEYQGEEMGIGINPAFVQDFLKEVSTQNLETIQLKVAGPRKPVILSPHDQYLYFMSPTAV